MKDYKKILEGVVDIINTAEKSDIGFANICTYIGENCPELKESEDERIRKLLIEAVIQVLQDQYCSNRGVSKEKVVVWFEKQGEQKPADTEKGAKGNERKIPISAWSEEDEEEFQIAIDTLVEAGQRDSAHWLKSLKDRVQPQPKQEWNKEDERILKEMIKIFGLENFEGYNIGENNEDALKFLKSLKERYTWKPSDEQMKALANACDGKILYLDYLNSLYNDLKKLKGE